jgi:hypothetical protein
MWIFVFVIGFVLGFLLGMVVEFFFGSLILSFMISVGLESYGFPVVIGVLFGIILVMKQLIG